MRDPRLSSAALHERAARLIERLSREFPKDPVPPRFRPDGSNDEESIDQVLRGRPWDEVDDASVASLSWLNCFLYFRDDQACYYLPTFLRYFLRDLRHRMEYGVWSMNVEPTFIRDHEDDFVRRFRPGQRRCVAEFIRIVIAWDEPFDAPESKPAAEEWASLFDAHQQTEERAALYAADRNAARVWADDAPSLPDLESRLSETLRAERADLVREIEAAFAGVRRGTSWRESATYGGAVERRPMRDHDADRPWPELVDDFLWNPEAGAWSFLDPVAVRYDLPAGMVRCLREFENWRLESFLTVAGWTEGDDLPAAFAALSFRQIRGVARFVRWMADWEDATYADDPILKGRWGGARDGFWRAVESWE